MIAYDLPDVQLEQAPAWIQSSRLAGAAAPCVATKGKPGAWSFTERPAGGCRAELPGFSEKERRPPMRTSEGWTCHLPRTLPPIGQRARMDLRQRELIAVRLRSGLTIGCPNAAEAPQAVVFTSDGGGLAGQVEQWSQDAWALYQMREVRDEEDGRKTIRLNADDDQTLRCISGALLRAYAVTHEWLSEYQMIQSADLPAFLLALWGLDPKALPGVGGVSRCLPPGLCQACLLPLPSCQE